MKTDIHPDYVECKVHCSCGNEFTTRSTVPSLRVELCSECHPFYTGKQKLVDTGGRVERFERRAAKAKKKSYAVADGTSQAEARQAEPRYMGGQAVLEGVMMRGETTWAVAVRKPDGDIVVDVRDVAGLVRASTARSRSCAASWASASRSGLGYRALTWSANQQVPEDEQVSEKTMGWSPSSSRCSCSPASSSCCPLFVGGRAR